MNLTDYTNTIDEIARYLQEKLQVPFDKAIEILQKQLMYELIITIVGLIVSTLFLVISWKIFKKLNLLYKKEDKYFDWFDDWRFIIGIALIIGITLFAIIFICIDLPNLIQIIVNPEWYIIDKIIMPLMN